MDWKPRISALLRSSVLLGIVAILAGSAAAWAGRQFLQQRVEQIESEAVARFAMAPVVVARRDMMMGEQVVPDALAVRPMPAAYLPSGALTPDAAEQAVGQRISTSLRRGEALQLSMLQSTVATLSRGLPEGRRALTVAVDDLNAHAGLLRAGDLIDVYLVQREGARSRIGLLQQALRVLATGPSLQGSPLPSSEAGPADFGTITLDVDDEQARRIVLARHAGDLSFVLRAQADATPAPELPLDSRSLMAPAARARAPASSDAVELLIGGEGGPSPTRHWLRVGSRQSIPGGA